MKRLLVCVIVACLTSCLSQISPVRTVKYEGIFPEGGKSSKRVFMLEVPKGGKLLKGGSIITGDYHTEYRITYPDSSIIYITNNEWGGSSLNVSNRVAVGITGYTKKHLFDTLTFEGKQFDEKYWIEHILGELVVGYVNVSPEKKMEYDRALATLRGKKNDCKGGPSHLRPKV